MRPVPESAAEAGSPASRFSRLVRQLPATEMAPLFARAILVVIILGSNTISLVIVSLFAQDGASRWEAAAYMAAVFVLQVFYFSNPNLQPRPPLSYVFLAVLAGLVFLPLFQFRQSWEAQAGFLCGSVLLVLPRRVAWTVFPLIALGMAGVQWQYNHVPVDAAYIGTLEVTTGLIVFGLTRLAGLVTELHQARTELAQLAVAAERLRFARDLHDLLGYSLSAITLKSELTHRLLTKNPEKAQEELAEVLDISRRALADVRSVARGYRELSLDAEAASARSVLLAADVDARMDLKYGELPAVVSTLLATVLREGITNVLRHSKAERCEVTVREENGRVRLEIVNDGVPEVPRRRDPDSGSGINNLCTRVGALGGTLVGGLTPDGHYRLRVTVPLPVAPRGERAGAVRLAR